jgi:protein arginine kinase activator
VAEDQPQLCDSCRQHSAELTVTEVDKHGKSATLHLCAECARERGVTAQGADKVAVAEVLLELKNRVKDDDRKLICPNCKLTYADFQASSRLGCAECYNAFAERLLPLIKRIHGAVKHTGRALPEDRGAATRSFEVQRLRRELHAAIEAENYEQAAAVRDRIRRAGGDETP